MPLPDFIVIGSMKSGTTTLHHKLEMHPSIGMSRSKEPNFFNKYFDRGLQWYESLFSPGFSLYGEASPNYTKAQRYPHTARNMHSVVPNAKLIYIVRDPVERIISHLHHNLYRDRLHPDEVDREVLENPEYIKTSACYYQVSEYLKYYAKEQFLFLSFENLKKDTKAMLNQICDFLGLDAYEFKKDERIYNGTAKKDLIKKYDFVHTHLPKSLTKPYHTFFYFVGIKRKRPELKEETIRIIRERLKDDITAFKKLTGKSFKDWEMYHQQELAV